MSLSIRLSLFYAAFFAVGGIMMPFWPLWLQANGLDAAEIGLVMAAALWVRVGTTPPISNWVDRSGKRAFALLALSWIATAVFALHGVTWGFLAILTVGTVFAMLRGPLLPLGDNIVLLLAGRHGLDYGRLRVWGSVSFLVATILGGWVLRDRPSGWILGSIVLLLALSALSAHAVPPVDVPAARAPRAPVLRVVGSGVFRLFLAASACTASSHAVFYAFGSVHWRSGGLDELAIGVLWGIGVAAEIAVFIWGQALVARHGPVVLMLAGSLAALLRWALTPLTNDFGLLCLLQVLHAGSFGLAHMGAMHFIARAAPADVSASAQGVLSTASAGLGLGFATLAAGPLFARFGGDAYWAMAGLAGLGTAATLLLMRRWRGEILKI